MFEINPYMFPPMAAISIPPNRFKDTPERKKIIRTRLAATFIGGVLALIGGMNLHNHEIDEPENPAACIALGLGAFAVITVSASELQERFGDKGEGDSGDDSDDDDGPPDDGPEDEPPDWPKDPGGVALDWMEIEDFLRDQESVGVA